jgi:phospholipid/cholesterol/gamma-HCH transport system substrate-binding protein
METRANYVAVGVFVLMVLAGAFGFVYWLYSSRSITNRTEVDILFPGSVTGLAVGGAVYFNGIRIGEVTRLRFAGDGSTSVQATTMVDPSAPLKKDVRAELGFTGLTGIAYVSLTGGTSNSPSLFEDEEVPLIAADRSAFEDLLKGARDILQKAETTFGEIEKLVTDNAPAVSRTLQNVDEFTSALAANSDEVRTLFADVGQAARTIADLSNRLEGIVNHVETLVREVEPQAVRTIVDNAVSFSEDLKGVGDDVNDVIGLVRSAATRLEEFTTGLNRSLGDVDRLIAAIPAEKIGTIVTNVDTIAAGFAGRMPQIEEFIDSARGATASIDAIATRIADRGEDLDVIITNVRAATDRIDQLAAGLSPAVADLSRILAAVDPTRVTSIVENADTVVAGVAGRVPQIEAFIDSARGASASIDAIATRLAARGDDLDVIVTNVRTATDRIDALAASLSPAVADVARILEAVDPTRISSIVQNIDTVSANLATKGGDIDQIVADVRSAAESARKFAADVESHSGDVDAIATEARQMVEKLNAASSRIAGLIDKVETLVEGDGKGLVAEATGAARAIRSVFESFEPSAGAIAGGFSKFSTSGLSDLTAAIQQARQTLSAIEAAVNSLERDPSRIIYGGSDQPTYQPRRR